MKTVTAIVAVVVVAVLVVLGVLLFGTGGSEDQDTADRARSYDFADARRVSPDALVDVPEPFFREPVRVTGEVSAVGDENRFALRGDTRAVLVQREPGVPAVERGDRVEVVGILNRVSEAQATGMGSVGGAPTGAGAPYISATAIEPR